MNNIKNGGLFFDVNSLSIDKRLIIELKKIQYQYYFYQKIKKVAILKIKNTVFDHHCAIFLEMLLSRNYIPLGYIYSDVLDLCWMFLNVKTNDIYFVQKDDNPKMIEDENEKKSKLLRIKNRIALMEKYRISKIHSIEKLMLEYQNFLDEIYDMDLPFLGKILDSELKKRIKENREANSSLYI